MSDTAQPGFIARAEDTLTDVGRKATQTKAAIDDLGQCVRNFDSRLPPPDAVLEDIAEFTRKNPLLALGAALAIGLWINRRR